MQNDWNETIAEMSNGEFHRLAWRAVTVEDRDCDVCNERATRFVMDFDARDGEIEGIACKITATGFYCRFDSPLEEDSVEAMEADGTWDLEATAASLAAEIAVEVDGPTRTVDLDNPNDPYYADSGVYRGATPATIEELLEGFDS